MIAIGETLDGKYRIVRTLGSGGFGGVYLADDEEIPGRQVAIKVLLRPNDEQHSNLVREMRTLAQFHHPHVVAFYHHFRDENRLYLVMEFCPGGSLYDRLRSTGHFAEEQVFAWGQDLCETLAFVHGKQIVHHDIKPMNVLFHADGTIKIGDFGIANSDAGTRVYLPPEWFLGERSVRLDPRVDVYALGITLLELLIGKNPFVGLTQDEAILARIEHNFIPKELPRWVQEVLLRATHPTPEMRFQTAADFADAIRAKLVLYPFDGKRIKADALAKKAEDALARKKWKQAERFARFALSESEDSVAALLAAGRCQLLIRRLDRAREFFAKAVAISPRTPVQKELGWINLEEGRIPTAISLLTDHLRRNAADYEAYNLLLKCFYLTDRFEAGEELAKTLMGAQAPIGCFYSNRALCSFLNGAFGPAALERYATQYHEDPFVVYNLGVSNEQTKAGLKAPAWKSKLLFDEYSFGVAL